MRLPTKQVLAICVATAGLAAFAARAQQTPPAPKPPQQEENSGPAIFRSDTRLVVLHTTVSDKNGHLVTDLPQTAFTVFENGVTQPIKSFKREDVPVSMGLIVDNSGSMRDKRSKVEAAALALVKDSNKDDEVFVVNFNDEAFLDNPHGKDFTNDVKEMEEALTRIDSRGGTAMRDAIRMSIDHLKEKAHKDKKSPGRGDRRQRQFEHDHAREPGKGVAAKRSADLRHRAAQRRGTARGQARGARPQ
jgi:hypothetical protein